MGSMKDNEDIACYFVTKHSWKGKYKRIFSVGSRGISTYNPNTLEITNQWAYEEFCSIEPNIKAPANNEFIITFKKDHKKNDNMTFSTDHKSDLITEALKFSDRFADKITTHAKFNAYKYHWSSNRVPVLLEVGEGSLNQVDPASNRLLCCYDYKDMEGLTQVSDYPGGVVIIHGGFSRLHLFALEKRDALIRAVQQAAAKHIGISIKQRKEPINFEFFIARRLGRFSTDEALTSCAEFTVQKVSPRHTDVVRRTLCLTETCLVERDPATYNVATCRPLSEVFAIVRDQTNPQLFSVEYVKGAVRTYNSTNRDALIASILDGVRASGNGDVHVKMRPTKRGYRLGPFTVPVDEEVERQHMKFIQSPPVGMSFAEAVVRFNCNVSYSGLLHAVTSDRLFAVNKERLISGTLAALLDQEGDQSAICMHELEAQFHALRRLVASKAGFGAFTQQPNMREKVGLKVVKALNRKDDGVSHAAIDMLCALMQPMHDDYDLRQEQLNKAALMSSKKFLESLLDEFNNHVLRGTGALVIMAMLDYLTFGLCAPYSETTDSGHFDTLLQLVAHHGRAIFRLFQHPSMAIVKGTGLVMKAIIEEGDAEVAAHMQELALSEGALPRHLHTAMFTQSSDNRMLTSRQLSRHLVGLWVTGHPTAMALLKRIMPAGLLSYLDSDDDVPVDDIDRLNTRDNLKLAQEQENQRRKNERWKMVEKQIETLLLHWRARIGLQKKEQQQDQKPVVLRKRRQRIKSEANWKLFYYHFERDHAKPNLIWNFKTREELRNALEDEIRGFGVDRDLSSSCVVAWNHSEFEVPFHCLADEIKIGDYYLRLLLEEDDNEEYSAIKRSYEFFNDLYHRFLLTPKVNMKCMCLQAMTIVYGRCHEEIGGFNDTKYMIGMLERCTDRLERDRLIQFLNKLILNKKNVKELMDANGVRVLVDLLTVAHLHTSRATVPMQSNVIEAAPDMMRESEKEWFYGNVDKERLGPYSFVEMKAAWADGRVNARTRCWSQGMDGWRPLVAIPQLKWSLFATGQAALNESDLATLILNMLIRMCDYYPSRDADGAIVRPMPRVKRLLSEATCLPHIVQLLLTFDPVLVEKVATLLYSVMQDNPTYSRLYLTGVFFFILMYTGSNVLPIARFLKYLHRRQAYRSEESKSSDMLQQSILGPLLPEAMICYLENYSAEKFAELFLGEFDTPEAIWSNEMRRLMIEKIASHLADFSPRLQSNTRALYQYCPVPAIRYPQLDCELFCSVYYLRHLCDTTRFPDWPIREPIRLLKDILDAWKQEVEKKPPTMSIEEAYTVLGLPLAVGGHEEAMVRKAYFKMAQKYHPDKNPEGRDVFERVNKAYEFLCSRSSVCSGPDPKNIVLVLRAQSILFSRYKELLSEYKYAGYPALVKTIRLESHDDALFSKVAPLLIAASELAFHTVNCSALNAEELRRENGIEVIQEAFTRCVSVLSLSSKPDDMAVQVCANVACCYAVASQFEGCRERIQETSAIIRDLVRILYYRNLPTLCCHVAACIAAFSVDFWLQTNMHQCGVLWHLLLFLFQYDYTLDEGGIEKSGTTNQQEVSNELARQAVAACARLGGYLKDDAATPDNPAVSKSLRALLTPYLAGQLSNPNPTQILKVLNCNTENPYLIWDNATRMELNEFLTDQQHQKIRTGECDPMLGGEFVFSLHAKELVIGEIFVRIYNEQPTFVLENPKGFTIDLLDFLGSQAEYLHSLTALGQRAPQAKVDEKRLAQVEMALEALRNVIRNNPGVEIQCIGHFKLLFSLLGVEGCSPILPFTLEVICSVTGNQECVKDIAASEVLAYLVMLIEGLPQSQQLVLDTLYPLMSNTKLLKESMNKGALVYLLNVYCNATVPQLREKSAELFAKVLSDKLVGPRVRLLMAKFLPVIFMDAMRDSAEASVHMFEGSHENPELVWNDDARERVCATVQRMAKSHLAAQRQNVFVQWQLADDFAVVSGGEDASGEVVIGGVFLRLFIANPGWVLRRPRDFLTELLDRWCALVAAPSVNTEVLEIVGAALVALLAAQPAMTDDVPQLGHLPKILAAMTCRDTAVPKAAVRVVHRFADSAVCVRAMSQLDCIGPMKIAMKLRSDAVGLCCEALMKMFETGEDSLVEQALKSDMIPFLIRLLDLGLEALEGPAATKAQIVKALKAMQTSLKYGEQVTAILEKYPVWREYKDQKHDLFLSDRPAAGYLQGPSVAGYLTSGSTTSSSSSSMPNRPPPM